MTRVIFIGGLGRSGTTLLERLLGELPGVVALGEVVHLWRRDLRDDERCGCGTAFSACGFWRAVGEAAFGGWSAVDVDRILALRRRVERTRHLPRHAFARPHPEVTEYAGYYRRVYAAAARVAGAGVVVDSSKHSALAWCLHQAGLDLRIVHLVRDPRAVAYSWTRRVVRPESDRGAEMTRYHPGRAALLWNVHNTALAALGKRGTPVRLLRYEELVTDPVGALRALAGFAGVDVPASALDFVDRSGASLGTGHSAAGNPMRFTVGVLPLRPDDAWRRGLPVRQRWLVGAVCAPLLPAYGYPLWTGADR